MKKRTISYNRWYKHWLGLLTFTIKQIKLYQKKNPNYHTRIKSSIYNQMVKEALKEGKQVQKWRRIKQEKNFWNLLKSKKK